MTALVAALFQLLLLVGAGVREHMKSRNRSDGRLAEELHDIETEVGAKDDERTQQELRDILGG